GGLRSAAQMVSYELALTMSLVGVLLMAGTFNLRDIINAQAPLAGHPDHGMLGWNIWPQILGFFCFFTAAVAETNRVPFDLPEAEQELVAGFHTEYASFKFAMFFIAEYTSMITVSCLCTIMFFGGWLSPFPASWNIWPQILCFFCFFTAAVAETNRVPFDLPEAEQELVAGFHTEYASFKFAMFFIAEYTSMITVSCLCTIMFFGGWLSPFPASW